MAMPRLARKNCIITHVHLFPRFCYCTFGDVEHPELDEVLGVYFNDDCVNLYLKNKLSGDVSFNFWVGPKLETWMGIPGKPGIEAVSLQNLTSYIELMRASEALVNIQHRLPRVVTTDHDFTVQEWKLSADCLDQAIRRLRKYLESKL